jgi:tRNA-2-methylthio-N6-dimethylallyladenosine synthase
VKIYVETYGCQMNEYDSGMIRELLRAAGHTIVPGTSDAEAVIVNTCSVRERAEERVLGRLRHLRGLTPPGCIIIAAGCVAQRMGNELLETTPADLVVGTDGYGRLPELIEAAGDGRRAVWTPEDPTESYDRRPPASGANVTEFVAVMRGCDNYCTYCIVPYVRGRERSRPVASVVREVAGLVERGAREVTLLGQNVNSYRDGECGFPELLRRVAAVPDLRRLRFATSHPKDLSEELIEVVASVDEVCEHVHLPVQSGSDRVLRAMGRRYDRARYVSLTAALRESVPGVAITTDIIVGFPGETAADYEETVSLMREVRFDSAFMFRYSVRRGTAASALVDDVPEDVKIERLKAIIDLQKDITWSINEKLVGSDVEVLSEGPSERDPDVSFGRTRDNRGVVLSGDAPRGTLVTARVREASAWTLRAGVLR